MEEKHETTQNNFLYQKRTIYFHIKVGEVAKLLKTLKRVSCNKLLQKMDWSKEIIF